MTGTTTVRRAGAWIAGQPVSGCGTLPVRDPWTDELVAEVALADPEHVEQALQLAHEAASSLLAVPAHRRADALRQAATGLVERMDEVAATITREAASRSDGHEPRCSAPP